MTNVQCNQNKILVYNFTTCNFLDEAIEKTLLILNQLELYNANAVIPSHLE